MVKGLIEKFWEFCEPGIQWTTLGGNKVDVQLFFGARQGCQRYGDVSMPIADSLAGRLCQVPLLHSM